MAESVRKEAEEPGQAELEAGSADAFDNLRYSLGRVELFREEIRLLGIGVGGASGAGAGAGAGVGMGEKVVATLS